MTIILNVINVIFTNNESTWWPKSLRTATYEILDLSQVFLPFQS